MNTKLTRGDEAIIGGDRFVINRFLGGGTEGQVYRAIGGEDTEVPYEYAVKFGLTDDPQFGHECEKLADKPIRNAVIPIGPYDARSRLGNTPAVLMPEVRGQDLDRHYDSLHQAATTSETANIMGQLALTLRDCEKHGVVHNDIKPANLVVERSGRLAVLDWSLTSFHGELNSGAGTPEFQAPEMVQTKPASAKQDVFSAGMTAAALLNRNQTARSFPETVLTYRDMDTYVANWKQGDGMKPIEDPLMRRIIEQATHHDVDKRSSPTDLMANLAAYPEARQHYSREEITMLAQHVIKRGGRFETRDNILDSNAARGLLEALPYDAPERGRLGALARLGVDDRNPAPGQDAARHTPALDPDRAAPAPIPALRMGR